MRNSDQFQTGAAANDWPSVVLARPVKVHYSRLHSALLAFLMIFFLGLSLVVLAVNGFTGAGVLIVALNVILLFVLYYVMSRARKRAACLFDPSGLSRGDGRRFSWSEFKGVDYLMAVRPQSGREYSWRIELAFTGGEAWIIPQRAAVRHSACGFRTCGIRAACLEGSIVRRSLFPFASRTAIC